MDRKRMRLGTGLLTAVACTAGMVSVFGGIAVAAPTAPTAPTALSKALQAQAPNGLSADGKKCFGKSPTKGMKWEKGDGAAADDFDWYITGTKKADVIIGTAGADLIMGMKGNDRICSLGGDDDISGQNGDDKLDAGDGRDLAVGDQSLDEGNIGKKAAAGNDLIYGGAGNDTLIGDHSTDSGTIRGQGGNDILRDSSNYAQFDCAAPPLPNNCDANGEPLTLTAGTGFGFGDVLVGDFWPGETGNVVGNGGDDVLYDYGLINPANRRVNSADLLIGDFFVHEGGNIIGDAGNDKITKQGGQTEGIQGDSVTRAELVDGVLRGGSIKGDGGDDILTQLSGGMQSFLGDNYADRNVTGQGGDDIMVGPDGFMGAGAGADLLGWNNSVAYPGTNFVTGDNFVNQPGSADTFSGGNDKITLGNGADGFGGFPTPAGNRAVVAGDNFIRQSAAAATADATDQTRAFGGGNDTISTGGGSDNTILGGGGKDNINGGPGDERIFGGDGNDTLNGGGGTDDCDGQANRDSATDCDTVVSAP